MKKRHLVIAVAVILAAAACDSSTKPALGSHYDAAASLDVSSGHHVLRTDHHGGRIVRVH